MGQGPIPRYKQLLSFEARQAESSRIRSKYPTFYPVIVEKYEHTQKNTDKAEDEIPHLKKFKYLCSNTLTVGGFISMLRERLKLKQHQALFLFCGNFAIAPSSYLLSALYKVILKETVFSSSK